MSDTNLPEHHPELDALTQNGSDISAALAATAAVVTALQEKLRFAGATEIARVPLSAIGRTNADGTIKPAGSRTRNFVWMPIAGVWSIGIETRTVAADGRERAEVFAYSDASPGARRAFGDFAEFLPFFLPQLVKKINAAMEARAAAARDAARMAGDLLRAIESVTLPKSAS